MRSFNTPILFLVFNRPESTRMVFDVIRKIKPTLLYIAADGPRREVKSDFLNCKAVRNVVENVDWECEVYTLYRDKNLGCKRAVSEALTWFFNEVEEGIILEDDTLPHPDFFRFCAEMLIKYRDDSRIWSINGCNIGYSSDDKFSYGFSRFMNMWGWATWRRSTILVDYAMGSWRQIYNKDKFLKSRLRTGLLDNDYEWVNYWIQHFDLTSTNQIDTWDYQWIYTQLKHQQFSIFPKNNLVINLGFNKYATHTSDHNHPLAKLSYSTLPFPYLHPSTVKNNVYYEEMHVKRLWCSHTTKSLIQVMKKRIHNYLINIGVISIN